MAARRHWAASSCSLASVDTRSIRNSRRPFATSGDDDTAWAVVTNRGSAVGKKAQNAQR
jgi:hypothetical protein